MSPLIYLARLLITTQKRKIISLSCSSAGSKSVVTATADSSTDGIQRRRSLWQPGRGTLFVGLGTEEEEICKRGVAWEEAYCSFTVIIAHDINQ